MPTSNAIHIKGLRELERAFALASKAEQAGLRDSLKKAAEPVRSDAEHLAVSGIRKIGVPWSRMRVGIAGGVVYVAPVQRGVRSRGNPARKRRNLAGLLMNRAMQPALDRNRSQVQREVEQLLDHVGRVWERG